MKHKVNGIDLYYEEQGTGQPIVFIHGLGSSVRDWQPQVAEFSRNYRVIAGDLRGHGQTDKPAGPYTIALFASDIAELLNVLHVQAAHIVGISLGGGVAFQFALDHPALCKTLTIVNSGPLMAATGDEAKKEIDSRIAIIQQMGMRGMGQALAPRLFPNPDQAALRESFVENWAQNDPDAYIASLQSMVGWNVMGQIASIRCPTLVITSDQDYTPVAMKEMYVKMMPNAELVVVKDAHHAVTLDQPLEFNTALSRFLAKNP